MYVINLADMAHEGGAEGAPHTPSPPHAPRPAVSTFHQQIMQNQSPRRNHIAERAKQTLENSFLLQLKKEQQLQQEILLQHFQQRRQQLAEQHEQQLRDHLKVWEEQRQREVEAREAAEAREARERHERDRAGRLERLERHERHEPSANASTEVKQKLQVFLKMKAAANANGTVPGSPYRNWGIVKSSSGESITSAGGAGPHPYRLPLPPPVASDFPLRKTASEPNMLKVRVKPRVYERRASPFPRRPHKARQKHRNCDGSSPRGSPPGGGGASAPIREEEEPLCRAPEQLFSSPSMPNISLGRPPPPPAPAPAPLPPVSEAEAYTPGPLPPRLGKRPLGRTHSAPLPLGDPALQPPPPHAHTNLHPAHLHHQLPSPAHHYLIRDQIRKTVLTRAHDAAAAQLREEEGEVIDLTSRRAAGAEPPPGPAAAPLARALSSPLVGVRAPAALNALPALPAATPAPATGLAYDPVMLKHGCSCGAHAPVHPEHSGRLQSVWARLCETGLAARTERTRPRKATLEELQSVHGEAHVAVFGGRAGVRQLVRLACGGLGVDPDTAWSDAHTAAAARMAAGAVLDLAVRVARGELRNGFAVVRPPGHHAEPNQAMGFCFFNSVAVAARLLHTRLRLQRILIVDWDVHHGNGTQQIFYEDPNVLYISIHRHDDGNFFPGTGGVGEVGAGPGLGLTVNVPWSCGTDPPLADAEYLAAFRSIVMPIAKEYDPEIVLVSCGFDAAAGHPAPLGGYSVSAAGFAHMTRELMTLANGRVVLSLEGGYDLPAVCDCAQECVRALLGEPLAAPPASELARAPHPLAQQALRTAMATHAQHWPTIKRHSDLIGMSALEAGGGAAWAARLGRLQTDADTAAAMATLSMHHPNAHLRSADSSRSVSEEPMEQDEGK